MNFNHGEIRFEHAPLIGDSLVEIHLMSPEADPMIVLIDEVYEDIGNRLVLEESNTELDGLEPNNKTIVIFKHLGYESLVGISSYPRF